ncbi:MAG: NAD(P)/FAD-dependent oxidoreductase [Thermoanaerobaculia bacterium]
MDRHVVIVGGGFAGLSAAKALRGSTLGVTLVDRRNHHLFQPLLYQVATAELNPSDIAAPIRHVLRRERNLEVLLAEVKSVDVAARKLRIDGGEIAYDRLIVASGATHSYFGHPEWERFAPGLKDLDDAIAIRARVLSAFESAEREEDPAARAEWLTFAIVGGGPTGAELAGALAEIARGVMAGDFRRIDPRRAQILLIEGADRILGTFPPELSEKARRELERLGVEVRTQAAVTQIDERGVVAGGVRIAARTVLWAAGVAASPLARSLVAPLDRSGRVEITPELTVPGRDDVFVVGDLATLTQAGRPVFGQAPAAMQAGRHAARNVIRAEAGLPLRPFHYIDKGSFAVIGRGYAVGTIANRVRLSGLAGWWMWVGIHIYYLIGFRNRLLVLLNWAYSYLARARGARLITGKD